MSADSPRRSSGSGTRGVAAVPAIVPPQVVSDRSILDSAIGFINEVTLSHQPPIDPNDTITWARFESTADISDPCFGEDWELEGNVAPPLLLILGYGSGVQVWAIPANGEAVEVLSWRHGIVSALRVLPTPLSTVANDEGVRADEPIDAFGDKRPLIALVDGSSTAGSQPQFCAVNFISLKTGAQVKTIKFKNPVIEILANRSSVVITFHERIAVFDARTLEDRLSITTCYPSPGINPNPAALGPRWLSYAENKLLHSKRSGGGCDGDGVASYTATVLNASKSLVKGLRELGEHVAAGLTGSSGSTVNSKNTSFDSVCGLDAKQAGVVTVIDVKNRLKDYSPASAVPTSSTQMMGNDAIIAHFIAHSEALVAMEFDNSGMLLVTADRRGHDFHVFRIQPNPVGPSLASVHHLYILHRGDTSAKVQNITLTLDSRWVAVSTLRGTTHVFPITPYGGAMGVRTHTSLHVVNKLSRFHRSAGLSGEGRSNSPIAHSESTTFSQSLQPYHNSTLPPFPRPTVVIPLAQLRQPFTLGSPPGSASIAGAKSGASCSGSGTQRQRLSSLSDDSGKPLSVCAIFAKSRSWLLDPPNVTREAPHRMQRKAVDSLFVMAGHGALIQYDLDTKLASNVAKEKICDDTPIELEVEAKAQWNLGRRKDGSQEIIPPLSADNWLIKSRNSCILSDSIRQYDDSDERNESWLSQVEIITHAGPHRRLWMGPQFVFKTYNTPSGSNLNHVDIEAVEIGTFKTSSTSNFDKLDQSSPLNMPLTAAGRSSAVPVLIESGSYSSIEQSPKLMDRFRHDHLDSDYSVTHGDSRLKEDLADAMRESPSAATTSKDVGGHVCESGGSSDNVTFYDALTTEDDQVYVHARSASAAALASVLPNIHSYDNSSSYESLESAKKSKASIEKIVNPLGTVTTITSCLTAEVKTDILDEVVSQLATEETVIHENCDESLFRPVVAIFCDEKTLRQNEKELREHNEKFQPPETISEKLVVPVIAKEVNDELSKREKEKSSVIKTKTAVIKAKEDATLNKEKGKEHLEVQDSTIIITKMKSAVVKQGKQLWGLTEDVIQRKEAESSTTSRLSMKETPAEKIVSQKIKPKDQCASKPKPSIDIETDVSRVQKTHQKMEFNKSAKKKLQASVEEYKDGSLKVKNIVDMDGTCVSKYETKPPSRNEQDKENLVEKSTSKQNMLQESLNESKTDCKSTVSVPSKGDQKQLPETKKPHNNVQDMAEPPLSPKNNTAIKERTKPNIKFEVNAAVADNVLGMEETESEAGDKETRKLNVISNKKANEELLVTKNPFVYEKDDSVKSELTSDNVPRVSSFTNSKSQNVSIDSSKNNYESLSLESRKDTTGQQSVHQKRDILKDTSNGAPSSNDCVEQKKIGKMKQTFLLFKEQKEVVTSKEQEPALNKKPLLDDKYLKETQPDFSSVNRCIENKNEAKCKEEQCSDAIIQNEERGKKINHANNLGNVDRTRKLSYRNKRVNPLEIDINLEKLPVDDEKKDAERCAFEKKPAKKESLKIEAKDEAIENDLVMKNEVKQDKGDEMKTKLSATQEMKNAKKDVNKNESPDAKSAAKSATNETKCSNQALNLASPKKKAKDLRMSETKRDLDLSKEKCTPLNTLDKNEVGHNEGFIRKESVKEEGEKSNNLRTGSRYLEITSDVCAKQGSLVKKLPISNLPHAYAWKTLSGPEVVNKNLSGSKEFPSLGDISKIYNSDKLVPEIPTPAGIGKQKYMDESVLKSLEPLPALPTLEPLQLRTENKKSISARDISLMTFESPLLETPSLNCKISPAPRGFTEQNLILALCGSLHYENEYIEKSELSPPTFSSNRSSIAFEDTSLGDYKSLSERDDPYMSLLQSSQDTNTTTTNTTNERFSSSTNSSGSEEIVIMEEKKMTKKQKRKKQQQLKEFQKQSHRKEIDDEELRPLIAMTDSQLDPATNFLNETMSSSAPNCARKPSWSTQLFVHSTTTDSEDPLPATTSDENVFSVSVPINHNPLKIKTKKLEHKINLIAAIEAATSSSTSSAEESGLELEGHFSHDNGESLISVANTISTSASPLSLVAASQVTAGVLKKKTKRRKR